LAGGHTEQLDESVAALAMVIRNALTRLPAEIARTTNYYRAQHSGSAPRRIMLAGGGANLPYTLEFFQEKLNLPVEYFNPVRNVALGKNVDAAAVQRDGHLMGELVGLGLRGIGKSAINIDLVPLVVEQFRAAERRKPFLIAAAVILLGGMAAWVIFQSLAATKAQEEAQMMDAQRNALAPLKAEVQGLLAQEESVRTIAASYTTAESSHAFWMDLIAELRGAFASDAVWLTDLEPLSGYNPLAAGWKVGDAKMQNGKPVVKADFVASAYGSSSLADSKSDPANSGNTPNKASAEEEGGKINAVRIRGFWRETPKGQNIVSELLKNLKDKSASFRFTAKDDKGADVDLNVAQYFAITVSAKPGDLGLPFEIVLPLTQEVLIK